MVLNIINGYSPYEQRKLAEFRSRMTIKEKYKERIEEACRWLNNFLYAALILEILEFTRFLINLKKKLLMIFGT